MTLTSAEEQVMKYLWKLEKAFFKDLMEQFPEPRPAITTVNTLLKRMIDKGFVAYTIYGNSREYYPLVKKNEYFGKHINGLIRDFFNNSAGQFASFFTSETELTETELKELKKMVDSKLNSKQNKKSSK
ncbi:MAG: BlaI/MecI/CopY family transcriptional regulator [Bacteroidota bacterium]